VIDQLSVILENAPHISANSKTKTIRSFTARSKVAKKDINTITAKYNLPK
jgi:hypothetical protein